MLKNKFLLISSMIFLLSGSIFAQSLKFNAKDIQNKNISDSIFEDAELTMINVWGTFCGPCIREMPDLGKLNKSYEEKGFQIVGIVIDAVNQKGSPSAKNISAAKKIVEQTGADYIHIVPDNTLLNGVLSQIYAVPTTFFVNSKGELVGQVYTGSRSLEDWQKIVDELLK